MKLRWSSLGLLFISFIFVLFTSIQLFNNSVKANTLQDLYSKFENVVEINVSEGPLKLYPTYYKRSEESDAEQIPKDASKTLYIISGTKTDTFDHINYFNEDVESVTYNVVFSNLTLRAGNWGAITSACPTTNLTINLNAYLNGTNLIEGYNHAALVNYGEAGSTFNVVFYPFLDSKSTFNAKDNSTNCAFRDLNPSIAKGWEAKITAAGSETENISDGLSKKPVLIEGLGVELASNSIESKTLNDITYGEELYNKNKFYTESNNSSEVEVYIKRTNVANGSSSIPSSDTYYNYQPYPSTSTCLNSGTYDVKIYQAQDNQNKIKEKEVHTILKIQPKKITPKIKIINKEYDSYNNFLEDNIFLINSSEEQKCIKNLTSISKDYFEENYSPVNGESIKFSTGNTTVPSATKTGSSQKVSFPGWSISSILGGNALSDNYELIMPGSTSKDSSYTANSVYGTINNPIECNLDEILNLGNTAILENGVLKNSSNNGWFNSTISLKTKSNYKILYTTVENKSLPTNSSSWSTSANYPVYNQSSNPNGLKDANGTATSEILSSSSGSTRIYFYVAKINDQGRIIQIYNKVTLPYTLNASVPTGRIEIANSHWDRLWKIVGFGIFKSEMQTVTITPGESVSGTTVEYLIVSDNEVNEYMNVETGDINNSNTLNHKIANASGWKKYDVTTELTKPKIVGKERNSNGNIVFAKIDNNAGKVSYINSNGIIIYTQSSTSDIETTYTKFSNSDPITVKLNGNTIKDIYLYGGPNNLSSSVLVRGQDYELSESLEGSNNYDRIRLIAGTNDQKKLFDNLTATSYKAGTTLDDRYVLKVSFNPGGIENVQWTSESGDKPEDIEIKLEIKKAEDKIDFNNDFFSNFPNGQITYSKESIPLSTPPASQAEISSIYEIIDNGEPLFKEDIPTSNEDKVATILNNQIKINRTGKFRIKISSLGNEYYNPASQETTVTVNQKHVEIKGINGVNREYDGTNLAFIDISGALIENIEQNDEVSITLNGKQIENSQLQNEDKLAEFQDSKVGNNKTVTPSKKFDLTGKDSYKYSINQPTTKANILKRTVRPINISIEPKVYDGKENAVISNIDLEGKIENEKVDFYSSFGVFTSPDVTTSESINNVIVNLKLSGENKENYKCDSTAFATGVIIKRKVKVETGNFIKIYDAKTIASYESGYPKLEEENSERGLLKIDMEKAALGSIPTPSFENAGLASENSNNIKIIFDGIFSLTKGTAEKDNSTNYTLENPSPTVQGTINSGFEISNQEFYSFPNLGTSTNTWIGSNDSFKIKASEGYKVGKSVEDFFDEISWDDPTSESGKEIIFYVYDINKGQISKPQKVTYFKDNTTPQGTISISINGWRNFLNTITFGTFYSEINDVDVYPKDSLSGVRSVVWWKDTTSNSYSSSTELENYISKNSFEWQSNLSNLGGTAFRASPYDKFVVYAKITDNSGNIGYINSNGVIFNNSKPSIKISAPDFENAEWSKNKDSKIEVTILHDLPVITRYSYKIGDNDPIIEKVLKNGVSGECPSNESFLIESLPDGDYDVIITATAEPEDKDLTQIKKIHVKKDTEAPKILSVDGNPKDYTKEDVTLTIEATDVNLSDNAYSFDKGITWQTSNKKSYSQNETIPENNIMVRDKAGNITAYDKEIIINKIDKLKPLKPQILGFSNLWTNKNVELTVLSQDAPVSNENSSSNIAYFEYTIDGGKTFKKCPWNQKPSFTISENGDYTNLIAVKITDIAGNTSDLSDWFSVKIDKTPPIITSIIGNPSTWSNNNIPLIINVKESLSGINSYSFDGGLSWQTDNFRLYDSNQKILANSLWVKDNAENISKYGEEIIIDKIDKLKPEKPQLMGNFNILTDNDVKVFVISKDKKSTDKNGNSGISKFEYTTDGGKTFNSLPWSENPNFIITKSGDYTNKIAVRTIDNAGNISDLSNFYSVRINKNKFKQIDPSTGIIIQAEAGVFPKDAKLVVTPKGETSASEKFDNLEEIYGQLDTNIKNTLERVRFYDISIIDSDGKEIQPQGSVTVNIPLPENFDKSDEDIDIYRVQQGTMDDDSFEENLIDINGTTYCHFETDHFSLYALVDKNTDSNYNLIIFLCIILLIIIIFILAFLYWKDKKYKHNT